MTRRPGLLVWGPAVFAAVVFVARELTRPPAAPAEPPGRAIALPILRTAAQPRQRTAYRLDLPRSCIRFLVDAEGVEHAYDCLLAEGTLVLGGRDDEATFALVMDLATLRPVPNDAAPADPRLLRDLLGVHSGDQVTFRGGLVARTTSPLPVLQMLTWSGTLRFGGRQVQQTLQLWQTAVPGQPIRLQGHGTVPTAAYGLQRRGWLGLFPEPHVVTLGFDLAWQRHAAR